MPVNYEAELGRKVSKCYGRLAKACNDVDCSGGISCCIARYYSLRLLLPRESAEEPLEHDAQRYDGNSSYPWAEVF